MYDKLGLGENIQRTVQYPSPNGAKVLSHKQKNTHPTSMTKNDILFGVFQL